MERAVTDALEKDRYVGGENVAKFEEEFAKYIGVDHAVSTSSGTAALDFIMISLGAKGKKYVTTPLSFIASANSILHAGGQPIFADVSETDYCLDPRLAEDQLRRGAGGLLPVHIYGHPAQLAEFLDLSKKYGIPLIEDACQAHGAKYRGRRVGSIGNAAAFSFYPSKNMTVLGDGGMVTTNDDAIARMTTKLRDSGRVSRYEHDVLGYTARLNTINAAIGRVQLRYLDAWNERRRQIASLYSKKLGAIPQVRVPPGPSDNVEPVYHQFVVLTRSREELKSHLAENGIECGVHYPIPIHLQPLYVQMYGFDRGSFARSEEICEQCLSLPMHPMLSDEDVLTVCSEIESHFRSK